MSFLEKNWLETPLLLLSFFLNPKTLTDIFKKLADSQGGKFIYSASPSRLGGVQ